MIKRQFLDFLYTHPKKHKKVFNYKDPDKGYSELFSPSQLLKEIDEETSLGKTILKDLRYQEKNLHNINMFSDQEEFMKIFEAATKDNASIQENSKSNI